MFARTGSLAVHAAKVCVPVGKVEWRAGDAIEPIGAGEDLTVADIVGLYAGNKDRGLLRRAAESVTLPESWKDYFRKRLGPG